MPLGADAPRESSAAQSSPAGGPLRSAAGAALLVGGVFGVAFTLFWLLGQPFGDTLAFLSVEESMGAWAPHILNTIAGLGIATMIGGSALALTVGERHPELARHGLRATLAGALLCFSRQAALAYGSWVSFGGTPPWAQLHVVAAYVRRELGLVLVVGLTAHALCGHPRVETGGGDRRSPGAAPRPAVAAGMVGAIVGVAWVVYSWARTAALAPRGSAHPSVVASELLFAEWGRGFAAWTLVIAALGAVATRRRTLVVVPLFASAAAAAMLVLFDGIRLSAALSGHPSKFESPASAVGLWMMAAAAPSVAAGLSVAAGASSWRRRWIP